MSKKVFEKYTRVCISGKNLYLHLHPSFKFLLKKPNSLPKWIIKNRLAFLSFLAGYADCEGSWIIIPDGYDTISFQFTLSTTDKTILQQLSKRLKELGFYAHLYLSRERGEKTNWTTYTKNLYSVVIYRKKDVVKLAKELLPLAQHPEKIERMRLILEIKDKKWHEAKEKVERFIKLHK